MRDKKIILFDGVCNFCNYWVRFVCKNNKQKDIYFMPLQDERVKQLVPQLKTQDMQSVVYYQSGNVFTHSTAALKILGELNVGYQILSKIGMIIPQKFRDMIYNFVGKRRYQWFGQKETCPIPSPDLKKQFL